MSLKYIGKPRKRSTEEVALAGRVHGRAHRGRGIDLVSDVPGGDRPCLVAAGERDPALLRLLDPLVERRLGLLGGQAAELDTRTR